VTYKYVCIRDTFFMKHTFHIGDPLDLDRDILKKDPKTGKAENRHFELRDKVDMEKIQQEAETAKTSKKKE
tara:strand:+ start:7119 stop:7331 length:213 start_codon:yes stop_codon:yes gene_type:complete